MEVAALVIRQKIDKPVRLHVKKGSGIRVRASGQRVAVKGARIYTVQRGPKVKRVSTKAGTSRRYNRKGSDAYRQEKRYYTTGRYQADPYYNKKRQVQAIQKGGYRKGKELKGKEKSRPGITGEDWYKTEGSHRLPERSGREQYKEKRKSRLERRHDERQAEDYSKRGKAGKKQKQADAKKEATWRQLRQRKIAYFLDKTRAEEEQKDSIAKLTRDVAVKYLEVLVKKAVAAIGGFLVGAALFIAVAFIPVVAVVTILYNSPFAIFLPTLEEGEQVTDVFSSYLSDFRKEAEQLAQEHSGCDEGELIYVDYEGGGAEPSNLYDMIAVYMVRYGVGDTASVVNDTTKSWMRTVMEDMCSYTLETGTEERDTGEKDKNGQAITENVSVLYVKVQLKTYSDMVAEYGFGEDEVAMLEELMRPENLALLGGNGADSFEKLTEEEIRTALGDASGDVGTALSYALSKVGYPYSQELRDSGDYYDCSSLVYYAWKAAGVDISFGGSYSAAAQAQGLEQAGKSVPLEELQPGDLIYFSYVHNGRYKNISHVAIYAGNGMIIEAANESTGVVYRKLHSRGSIVTVCRP